MGMTRKISHLGLGSLGSSGRAVEAASIVPGKALSSISGVDGSTSVLEEVADTVGIIVSNSLAVRLGSTTSSNTVLAVKGTLVDAIVASSIRVVAPALTTTDGAVLGISEATAGVVELVAGGLLLDSSGLDVELGEVADAVDIIVGDGLAVGLGGATGLDAAVKGQLALVDAVVGLGLAVGAVADKAAEGAGGDVDQVALLKAAAGQLVVGGSGNGGD